MKKKAFKGCENTSLSKVLTYGLSRITGRRKKKIITLPVFKTDYGNIVIDCAKNNQEIATKRIVGREWCKQFQRNRLFLLYTVSRRWE